jgi:ribonuclease D
MITTRRDLQAFCGRLGGQDTIALDTEFVSEDTYRPQLCLIQVAVSGQLAVIDTLAVGDVTPFWEALVSGEHETIVHAGREEVSFCIEAAGRPPRDLFDVQLAAGLVGLEYPASYGSLMSRLLGRTLHKRETRTDWRRRPLSAHQIEYALDDVRDLQALRDELFQRLEQMHRLAWLRDETARWLADLQDQREQARWRRVSGSGNLSSRELAVLRELWRWRDQEAQRRNQPVRRVLRDDLMVELAKRRSADPKQISAVRGLDRPDLRRTLPGLSAAILAGLKLPDEQCPKVIRRETNSHLNTVAQFLASALASICRTAKVAPSIVGSAQDVRDLIAYRLGEEKPDQPPLLAEGWRAEVVGHLLEEVLQGRMAIRIRDPRSEEPLVFESREG